MSFILLSMAAAAAATSEPPIVVPEHPKKEVKICRREETTGSRIPDPHICKTAKGWRLTKEAAERMLDGRRDMHDVQPYNPSEGLAVRQPPQ